MRNTLRLLRPLQSGRGSPLHGVCRLRDRTRIQHFSPVDWQVGPNSNRPEGIQKYLVDQTTGYRENLKVIESRQPDFVLVTGDLVESGGEQRDWDEFWRHNAGDLGRIASAVPLFPAIGNHENYGGPGPFGGYSAEAANFGVAKFLAYFSVPDNNASDIHHRGRYYRVDFGLSP